MQGLGIIQPCRSAAQVIELDGMLHTSRVWQEVSLLRQAKHPRIVQLLGVRVEVRCRRYGLAGARDALAMQPLGR